MRTMVPLDKLEKLLKLLHGWMCYRLYMAAPERLSGLLFRSCYPLWVHVAAWAGYYVSFGKSK